MNFYLSDVIGISIWNKTTEYALIHSEKKKISPIQPNIVKITPHNCDIRMQFSIICLHSYKRRNFYDQSKRNQEISMILKR